ncbi:rhamnulokinase [Spelaeicoccus albus]|uniref:Rhamnulokinase n=1 Tax=Spelaeicoccus albus TaxID=1280376 RepID=A0A7Z0AAX8_9MICO|nr:rhamnulokinase family protein [Spelaeicoccus albus]NYI66780.1 rhamnulokinase [Spelaeicoccus albus]
MTVGDVFAAIDIGASGGRVIAGQVSSDSVTLDVVHRFDNGPIEMHGTLRWDAERIADEMLRGLHAVAGRYGPVAGIGIDTWAIDYGVVDPTGKLTGPPFSYRDDRSVRGVDAVRAAVPEAEFYARTGLQHLPFTTIYQLAVETGLGDEDQAMLMPDLLAYRLTGRRATEATNASTTGLFDATRGDWSPELFAAVGRTPSIFPTLIQPGETIGTLTPAVAAATGLPESTPVIAVGTHDTASAVVGLPGPGRNFAYISSGTWSLVGVELDRPVLTEASRAANFTNERGVDGRIRYLRNLGGLWLLQESLRQWELEGLDITLAVALADAASVLAGGPTINPDSEEFVAPGNMPNRIRAACAAAGQERPETPGQITRCILESLAAAYAATVRRAAELSGMPVEEVRVVGGGSQNRLLCQLTADAVRLPVLAGPVEATALGNVLVQARSQGVVSGGLEDLRSIVAASTTPIRYEPLSQVPTAH